MQNTVVKIPWTSQPPQRVDRFDNGNFFGRHCLQAIIPGWYDTNRVVNTPDTDKLIRAVGHPDSNDHIFISSTGGGDTNNNHQRVTKQYGPWGVARAWRANSSANQGLAYRRSASDFGINFPDSTSLSVIVLIKPTGYGNDAGGDPRIYSKDSGHFEQDHDLMVGSTSTSARSRIRINGSTQTVVVNALQSDSLNMISGGVENMGGATARTFTHLLREDGGFSQQQSGTVAAGYTPRNTTGIALGNNYGQNNIYDGEIIAIFAFDIAIRGRENLQALFANPWQIFEPQEIPVYFPSAAGGKSASGDVELPVLTAGGTAKLRKPTSGAADIPTLLASGVAKLARPASGAAILSALSGSGAAQAVRKSSGNVNLPALTGTGASKVVKPASGVVTLPALESGGQARVHSKASGDVSVPNLVASGIAAVIHRATGSANIPALIASGAASKAGESKVASGAAILPVLIGAGAANVQRGSSGAATLAALVAAGTATVRRNASGDVTLPILTASGAANGEDNSASGDVELPSLVAAGIASVRRNASGAVSIPSLTASGAAVVHGFAFGAAFIPTLVSFGNSSLRRFAVGSAFIPALTATGNVVVGGATIINISVLEAREIAVTLSARYNLDIDMSARYIDLTLKAKK